VPHRHPRGASVARPASPGVLVLDAIYLFVTVALFALVALVAKAAEKL
jgi:hypothetical protein